MSSVLLVISIIILSLLSVYAALYIFLSLSAFFIFFKKKAFVSSAKDRGEVAILIPARNEGEAILDAIASSYKQDYRGRISISILLKDESDSSWPFLQSEIIKNKNNWQRNISIVLCAEDAKSKKLNYILPKIEAGYIAILDADHRPSQNWISSSLALMENKNASVAQTRRAPLDISSLPQIWDSGQNHGGNELLNICLSFFGKNVFFTGTAAVFKRELFKEFSFSNSITEDTFLSYQILTNGKKIVYNGEAVSYEEVAPSLRAYVFRRRRWSAGHNQTFFKHIFAILKSKLSFGDKLIMFAHAKFYLIPLAVLILLNVYGLHFFSQMSASYRLAIILITSFLAFLLASFFRQNKYLSLLDFLIAFAYLWPQVAVLSVLALRLSGSESYFYILSFPLAKQFTYWQLALFLAPILPLIVSGFVFKTFKQKRNLWIFPSYPISLFLDIYAAVLGFFDFIFSRTNWSVIRRTNKYSAKLLPNEIKDNLLVGKEREVRKNRIYIFFLFFFIVLFLLNDLLAVNDCGQVKKFFWQPVIFKPSSSLNLDIELSKKASETGGINISAPLKLSGAPVDFWLDIYVDGIKTASRNVVSGEYEVFSADYPYGFSKHEIAFKFETKGLNNQARCYRRFDFSTTLKELKGKDLFVNGEKFLIKGMVPSFFGGTNSLDMADGFRQIKEIGVNVLRFYHGADEKIMKNATENGLLIMDQPDRSTWDDFNPLNNYQSEKFIERYGKLLASHNGNPFSLWTSFGNEWELGPKSQSTDVASGIFKLIEKAQKNYPNFPSTYSTYYTFIDYPIDITAINMLDTGDVYWVKVINMLRDSKKPFYASEFGGFIAFLEETDPEIRYNRLLSEWDLLIKANALGANFFESHDNWAQPIVEGYNDPNKPEKSDDKRGFWTNKNKEKLELGALREILSDLTVNVDEKKVKDCSSVFSLKIENKREYNLKGVVLEYNNKEIFLGDFLSREARVFDIDLGVINAEDFPIELSFKYTTHSGLSSASKVKTSLPCYGTSALILNSDFQTESKSEKNIYGRLIASGDLKLFLPPEWGKFIINGKEYSRQGDFQEINIGGPYYDVMDMAFSRDKGEWKNFSDSTDLEGGGLFYIRFKWPETFGNKKSLILSGLGGNKVTFYINGKGKDFNTHNYRENAISASELGNPNAGDTIIFSIDRNQSMYVSKQVAMNFKVPLIVKNDIMIEFEKPRVFSPAIVNLEKMP